MVTRLALLPLYLASVASARFAPRSTSETVHLDALLPRQAQIVGDFTQNADGSIPYFDYEKLHLTSDEVKAIQSKLSNKFGSQWSDYWNLFSFSSVTVTEDHNTPVNYTLSGPDSCKPFPGDAAWPSILDWVALDLVTGGALIMPKPQAHVCYTNATGSIDTAACKYISDNWNGQYWQNRCVLSRWVPAYRHPADAEVAKMTRSKCFHRSTRACPASHLRNSTTPSAPSTMAVCAHRAATLLTL